MPTVLAVGLDPVFVAPRLHADADRKWFFIGLIALGGYSVIRALISA